MMNSDEAMETVVSLSNLPMINANRCANDDEVMGTIDDCNWVPITANSNNLGYPLATQQLETQCPWQHISSNENKQH